MPNIVMSSGGKGVMAKDGKTPFNPGILYVVRKTGGGQQNSFLDLNPLNSAIALAKLANGEVDEVVIVDEDNDKFQFRRAA